MRYFLSYLLLGLAAASPTSAQTFTVQVLHNFDNYADGGQPYGRVIEASDGNFYGTTYGGGDGYGSVFKLTPQGVLTTLYAFQGLTDGGNPFAGLTEGPNGNFYGTTIDYGSQGVGTVFEITPSGTFTLLYTSPNDCCSGGFWSEMIPLSSGVLLGTSAAQPGGAGMVYQVDRSNNFTILYQPSDQFTQGFYYYGGIVQATDENFYGAADLGGDADIGAIYRLTGDGSSVISSFDPGSDGSGAYGPESELVEGPDGNLYGTTRYGGGGGGDCGGGCGSIFKVALNGSRSQIHAFGGSDGADTTTGPFPATDGNLYGMTTYGGNTTMNSGVAYKLTPKGQYTVIHNFTDFDDGGYPFSNLIQGSDGNLYGTTNFGGTHGYGTVFRLVPSTQFVPPIQLSLSSSSIQVGSPVTISWFDFGGFSKTLQTCFAYIRSGGSDAGAWSGLQTGTLLNGIYQGSAVVTPTTAGTYVYDLTCGGMESAATTLTVLPNGKPTPTLQLTVNPTSPSIGQEAFLFATLAGSEGTPTGSVSFSSGTLKLATISLQAGIAEYSVNTSTIKPGTYPLSVSYSGDTVYNPLSETQNVVVNPAPTQVSLTASPATVPQGSVVTLQATVARTTGRGFPGGSVSFYYRGADFISTVPLDGQGVATFKASTTGVPRGNYDLTARYLGDADDAASASSAITATVQ